MADYTVTINLPDHKAGDGWPGIAAIGPVIINGTQPDNPLERIRMQFRGPGGVVFKFDSDASATRDAPITIDNATTWEASVAAVSDFLTEPGSYDWDMEFHQTGAFGPWTLYKGKLTVHGDVTNDT